MLEFKELEEIGALKRLRKPQYIERDYLQEVVLLSLYSFIGNDLIFKGGTCLYKIYKLDRFSEDLDFTLNVRRFDIDSTMQKIVYSLSLLGIVAKVERIKKYKNQINVLLEIRGPLYKGRKEELCYLPINISMREKVVKPVREKIHSLYRDIVAFDVLCMSEKEILTEKIRAMMTRNVPRDVYDFWFLLKKGTPFDENLLAKKFRKDKIKFELDVFLKKIDEKKATWETDLRGFVIGELLSFDEVKNEINNILKEMMKER